MMTPMTSKPASSIAWPVCSSACATGAPVTMVRLRLPMLPASKAVWVFGAAAGFPWTNWTNCCKRLLIWFVTDDTASDSFAACAIPAHERASAHAAMEKAFRMVESLLCKVDWSLRVSM